MQPVSTLISRIKLMCGLGIYGQTLAPALLRELHDVVQSCTNTFLWLDEQYSITNIYDESPKVAVYIPKYFKKYHYSEERCLKYIFDELIQKHIVSITDNRKLSRYFYCSRFFNEVFRPMGYHHSALVGIKDNNRNFGVLALNRCEQNSEFSTNEIRLLMDLIPYIANGINCRTGSNNTEFVDSEESGLIVVNLQGNIEYISPQGRMLLFLATHPTISVKTICKHHTDSFDKSDVIIPGEVRQLCNQLLGLVGNVNETLSPMIWKHSNSWGGFIFGIYWLKDSGSHENSLIGITIKRQIPLQLKLLHHLTALSLTPKQIRITLHLIAGQTYNEIANHLQISTHTVIDHVRKLQEKFNVHNRSELLATLLTNI
ncbi:MAG: LuxR C-terminal-related transcriptional regulator [Candidatus Thiodiazotropha taylori]|uniref:LuxR C-terminal-related transcriptional regulator n=1 Tax=Candidatus Thiodiazotropha taylori TaxID=2792791 RepID=A0A9E4KAR2_9GAMM|nr:LuxR C-terminal-related transcriptional regulator [Candidatus Thiodiazotropha taylori]MCW4256348.1 LuxR C-terminal-related transcriptional regulator [Candidatus Thiodiazotropha taylori]